MGAQFYLINFLSYIQVALQKLYDAKKIYSYRLSDAYICISFFTFF